MKSTVPIPVIDLFAGPGGLGEGFSSVEDEVGRPVFRLTLSIEKDDFAVRTLVLRAFFRAFNEVPDEYYDFVRLKAEDQFDALEYLFDRYPKQAAAAKDAVLHATLGRTRWSTIFAAIDRALGGQKRDSPWVLIGGPPCQAYSLVGRARMTGLKDSPERARLHRLYRHYLHIIDRYRPPVFVMENVKGLLSARVNGKLAFERIVAHLRGPHKSGVSYEVLPLVVSARSKHHSQPGLWNVSDPSEADHRAFLIRSEQFGVPQTRHRVIVLGIERRWFLRLRSIPGLREALNPPVGIADVIHDLPRLRSGPSRMPDSIEVWRKVIGDAVDSEWIGWMRANGMDGVAAKINQSVKQIQRTALTRGGSCVPPNSTCPYRPDWYHDPRLPGACNHESRAHIEGDLARYLFASSFASVIGRSPKLADFPPSLRPAHANVQEAVDSGLFSDRFRVQLDRDSSGRPLPGSTVTSHISKDGHYFIHYDPTQCRSLTVREAARVQTFPDNYIFLGPRTEQYRQVGNAVPPLLACQIAETVAQIVAPSRRLRAKGLLPAA